MKYAFVLLGLFLVFPTLVVCQYQERAKYVNFEYASVAIDTTLPNGVKHLGGSLIGQIEASPVYGVSIVSKERRQMLWLERSTDRMVPA